MTIYWMMFLFPVIALLLPLRGTQEVRNLSWGGAALGYALIVGFRYEIGTDWSTYLDHYNHIEGMSLEDVLAYPDVGYFFINWLSSQLSAQIYGVNLFCGLVVATGLTEFARRQPMPWLALAIGIPYLLIVVTMGYSRQGVAIGFGLWALSALEDGRRVRFFMLLILAMLFHRTAIALLPLGLLLFRRLEITKILIWSSIIAISAVMFVADHLDYFLLNFVQEQSFESAGANLRVWMNAVPAILLILTRKHWLERWKDTPIWLWAALLSILIIPLVDIASTATDRMALYLSPIQMVVYSRIPILIRDPALRTLFVLGVIGVYGLALWVWLNYSPYAQWWVPYKSILIE